MSVPLKKIVLVGAGVMGRPMSFNLHRAGFDITAVDPSEAAALALQTTGIACVDHLEAAAKGADAVILMLADGKIVADSVDRVIRLPQAPRLLIDCSSTDVVLTRELAAKSEQRGLPYLDAPVSGGPEGAAAATLSFLVGGKAETLAAAKPILDALGKKIVHFGHSGMGQLAKACHNLIVSIEVMAICEGFAVAEANGLDPKLFYELCMNAAAKSWAMQYRCPIPHASPDSPSNRNYAAGGSAAVVVKDLGIALSAAKSAGLAPELGPLALKAYRTLVDKKLGHLDLSAIYLAMRPKPGGTAHEVPETGWTP